MVIFISYPISTRDTHISPRAEGGGGLLFYIEQKAIGND